MSLNSHKFCVLLMGVVFCSCQVLSDEHLPQVVIGPVSAKPEIDGKLDDPAWQGAAEITGFMKTNSNEYAVHQPAVTLGYDDHHLYVAIRSPIYDGQVLQTTPAKRDDPVWQDDCVEIYVDPTPDTTDYFQIVVNSAGVVYDRKANSDRAASDQDAAWNLEGIAATARVGETEWTMEMAIPCKGLGVERIVDETRWLFNICETRQGIGTLSICAVRRYNERTRFGELVFRRELPRVRIAGVGPIASGKASILAGYAGPAGCEVDLLVKGRRFDETANTWFALFSKSAALTRDVRKVFEADESELKKSGRMDLEARSGSERIYAASFAYEVLSNVEIEMMRVVRQEGKKRLMVRTCQPYDRGGAKQEVRVRVSRQDGNPVATSLAEVTGQKMNVFMDISDMLPGAYRVSAELLSKGGVVAVADQRPEFVVYPHPPPWHKNSLGVSKEVPAPWTPIEANQEGGGVVVRCWNREYRFGRESLLPEDIISGGQHYLHGPVVVTLFCKGEASPLESVSHHLVRTSPKECVIGSVCKVPWGEMSAETTVEFDGFIWVDLELRPREPIEVDRLALEWEMPSDRSRLLHSGYRSLEGVGQTPDEWHKKLNQPLGPFWVGDEKGGISFAVESFEGWSNADENRQAEVLKGEKANRVRINIVDKPRALKDETVYGFCFHPTPVRPRPSVYRKLRPMGWMGKLRGGRTYPINFSAWNATNRYSGSPIWCVSDEELEWYCQVRKKQYDPKWYTYRGLKESGVRSTWYLGYRCTGRNSPGCIWGAQDWQAGRRDRLYSNKVRGYYEDMIAVCKTDDFTDYYLWQLDKSMTAHPVIDGLYFDLMGWEGCTREDHGHGYEDEEGRRRPSFPIRQHRKWLLRIYTYIKERNPKAPILLHLSGQAPKIMGYSFCDYHYTGELWIKEVQRDLSYKALPLDTFRTEALSQPWGPGKMWISQLRRALTFLSPVERKLRSLEPWAYRHAIGLFLVHDSPIRAGGLDGYLQVWEALDRFGLEEGDRLAPYWEDDTGIDLEPDDANIVATAYAKPDSALLIVFNNTDADRDVDVTLDTEKLFGRTQTVRVSDAEAQEQLAVGNPFSLPVRKRDFRLLTLHIPVSR